MVYAPGPFKSLGLFYIYAAPGVIGTMYPWREQGVTADKQGIALVLHLLEKIVVHL